LNFRATKGGRIQRRFGIQGEGKLFKTKLLASACQITFATALLASIPVEAALAQTADSPAADPAAENEIVVSGIRQSLTNSALIKRNADVVVDAITAEDIGKFPDQNIAESLQRITGVTIDRSGGEGQLLTVRGLGPEFNSTLLNGRRIASVSGGRAFSFDVLPAELMSGAEVYKTQSSFLQDGSIGATVDLKTARPFQYSGFKAVASVSGLYDGMTEKVKPQFSALISDTFAEDTVGLLASVAYYKRESRYDQAITARYFKTTALLDGVSYGTVYFPRNYDQIVKNETRERLSGSLVAQFRPSDNFEITIDGLYSNLNVKYKEDVFPHWFTTDTIRNPVLDENNTVVKADFVGGSIESLVRQSDADNTLWATGFNAKWNVSDTWTMNADISYSKAESDPGQGWSDNVVGRPGRVSYDRSSGDLIPTMTYPDGNTLDPNGLLAGWASLQGTRVKDDVLEARLDNTIEFDDSILKKLRFGAHYSDRTLGSTYSETEGPLPWAYGDNSPRISVPASLFSVFDSGGFLTGASGQGVNQWITFNSDQLMAFLITEAAVSQLNDPTVQAEVRDIIARNGGHTMVPYPDAYEVNEKLASLYADVTVGGDLGTMPWSTVLGLRYVHAKSKSIGQQIGLVNLVPDLSQPGSLRAVYTDDYVPVTAGTSYDDFLPSVNAKLELTDKLIARFAWSKSLTRPELTEMSPLTSYEGGPPDQLFGSGANPALRPFKSTNWDLSLEWYYNKGGYVSIAGFKKNVDGYLGSGETTETVTLPSGTYTYEISRPVNLDSAKITGVEIAFQHMATYLPSPFDGLGIQANMTFVDSSSSSNVPGQKLPLIGLGDSSNFILFYEKGPIEFRVAYNKRNRFMQAKPTGSRDAHYVDDYKQIDVSASFDVSDNFTVFFEGINITNELYIKNAEFKNQTLEVTENGPRYTLGVRAKF
jgi:TonB-dependent receptor